jgi:hypothetical protein
MIVNLSILPGGFIYPFFFFPIILDLDARKYFMAVLRIEFAN